MITSLNGNAQSEMGGSVASCTGSLPVPTNVPTGGTRNKNGNPHRNHAPNMSTIRNAQTNNTGSRPHNLQLRHG